MRRVIRNSVFFALSSVFLFACKVDNLEFENIPKTDFSSFNYVLATEDASTEDITTFFAFNLPQINPETTYDLFNEEDLFINSNPSTSSGQETMGPYFFSLAKDKHGYSSTPGLYRLTLNTNNRVFVEDNLNISKNNLFPARQLSIVNEELGFFYNEGKDAHKILVFNPTKMVLTGSIDLKPLIQEFRPNAKWVDNAGNNLIRTGSMVIAENEGKLYVSIAFLETAGLNLISEDENHVYMAVIDVATLHPEKIIAYEGAKTVGFFVSENKATTVDDDGNLYFCSWGWNQFNEGNSSQVFRIKSGETDFDEDWVIDIEALFGERRIAQSIVAFNNKLYLHISDIPYGFYDSDGTPESIQMSYYVVDPSSPDAPQLLDIPVSNAAPRISAFTVIEDKLFVAVPNVEQGKFNGFYSIDSDGNIEKEISIANKYRPTKLYKLGG